MYAIIPAEERAALIDLYNATDGDNWINHKGWRSFPHDADGFSIPGSENHWYGIVIKEDHVVKIKLNKDNLNGALPSTLGNLSELSQLYLERNHISGPIPPELGKLANLRILSLGHNQLSSRIPYQLGNLGLLNKLLLGHNLLTGSIPSQLGKLSHLKSLYLDNNQLSSSIPTNLVLLESLKVLDLSENQLSGIIPPELGDSMISALFLDNNQLSGDFPSFLEHMSCLNLFYLDNNKLSGEIPFLSNFYCIAGFDVGYNCLHAANLEVRGWLDAHNPGWWIHQDQCAGTQPAIRLNCTQLYFCALAPSLQTVTGPQEIWISNSGLGQLNWNIITDGAWLNCTPHSGTGNGIITVSVNPAGLSTGTYNGSITITDIGAVNSPRYISVTLTIKPNSEEMPPFGTFLTPTDGANVYGSIPVTGWALDDIGIQSIKIYREEGQYMKFIGNAVFVDSARPDIEETYPGYPFNYKAGWGYMMLTNSLPNGGNGVFKLYAFATDVNGNTTNLGSKTISVDNDHAVKPFGYIDTPMQCGVASGKNFVNWGWVLTPLPNFIPNDGSTIVVCVDGVKRDHPIYNLYREDIVAMFPGFANSNGALGKFYLDTTSFQNGIHTLYWSVSDNAGNIEGIGSRYFSILNTNSNSDMSASDNSVTDNISRLLNEELPGLIPGPRSVVVKKRYNDEINPEEIYPDEEGLIQIQSRELERLVIILKDIESSSGYFTGYLVIGNEQKPLPIGSTLDGERGIFYWQPGPGFIGNYRFIFIEQAETGPINQKEVIINIGSRYNFTRQ